jgi:uncharacterized membrane protein HdeD (DUF308 family)
VPLSEREQKILQEIEKNLYQEDPTFARGVRREPRFSQSARARLGVVVFVAGVLALISFFFSRSVLIGVLAFGAMVAGMVLLASSVKAIMSSDGGPQPRLSQAIKRLEERARKRHKRD